MKVRYSLPVRGKMRLLKSAPIQLGDWEFHFECTKNSEYVDRLTITISNIPKENWPTMTENDIKEINGIPVFPFKFNIDAVNFSEIEPKIINLESYLSVFGLEEIDLKNVEENWIRDDGDDFVPMLSGFKISPPTIKDPANPISEDQITRCIVASNASERETASLAHFRVGQSYILNHRHIEAIRHLYLSIEYMYANGKHQQNATVAEFMKSQNLTSVVKKLFLNPKNKHFSFEKIKHKYKILKNIKTEQDFYMFIFQLRGNLQHANPNASNQWHPSRQNAFEHEAICIMNVVEEICFNVVVERMNSVPIANSA